jgi:uncharacterized protein YxjI
MSAVFEDGAMRYLIRERFLALGDDSDITDDQGRPVLHVDGKVLSLRDRLVLKTPDGAEAAEVTRRLIGLRPTYRVSIGEEHAANVRKHFFTPFRERYTIDVPGPDDLEVTGDLLDHEFTVERSGRVVATATRRLLSIRDTYAVDISPGENDLLILAAVLAVDLAQEREHQ